MTNHPRNPEDLAAAYTLLLLARNPVQFVNASSLPTRAKIEHDSWDQAVKRRKTTYSNNITALTLIRPRCELHDSMYINRDGLNHTKDDTIRFKVSLTSPDGKECNSNYLHQDEGNLTSYNTISKVNAWLQQLPPQTLDNKDGRVKNHRDRWTAIEMEALKSNASLLKKPKLLTEQRRATLAEIFPNRTFRALRAKLSKIRAAESKAAGKLEELEVIGSFTGNPEGMEDRHENSEVI